MTVVTKAYTFAPATDIKSAEVNENFDRLYNYINNEVVVRDASMAFTAIPSGPGTDPTSSNQLARKAYVDQRVKIDGTTAFTGIPSGPATNPTTANQFTRKQYVDDSAVTPLTFRPSMATTGQIIKADQAVVTTDIFGHATVPFVGAFPTSLDTIVCMSGDAGVATQFMSIHARTTSNFTVRCFTVDVASNALVRAISQMVRVNYIAIGR